MPRLAAHYGVDPVADVQVFAPVYRGAVGIDALNAALREQLNPGGAPVLGGRLREGDKVMLSGRNLHDLGLMNGTVLRLVGVREDLVTVSAEGVDVDLPDEDAPALRLAYACSVHKGQGIELPVAILVAHPAAGAFFLRREMLYTAMTRARLATVIVGTRGVVEQAAAKADTSRPLQPAHSSARHGGSAPARDTVTAATRAPKAAPSASASTVTRAGRALEPPRQQAAAEGVARADRVDHARAPRGDLDDVVARDRQRAVRARRHHRRARPAAARPRRAARPAPGRRGPRRTP